MRSFLPHCSAINFKILIGAEVNVPRRRSWKMNNTITNAPTVTTKIYIQKHNFCIFHTENLNLASTNCRCHNGRSTCHGRDAHFSVQLNLKKNAPLTPAAGRSRCSYLSVVAAAAAAAAAASSLPLTRLMLPMLMYLFLWSIYYWHFAETPDAAEFQM